MTTPEPQYTPIIETLLERVAKLEADMAAMNQHQHQSYPALGTMTTRPTGYGSKR